MEVRLWLCRIRICLTYIIDQFAVWTSTPEEVVEIITASTRNTEATIELSSLMLVTLYGAY